MNIGEMLHSKSFELSRLIKANEECFVLKWCEQNKDKDIDDYTMCHGFKHTGVDGEIEYTFCMQRKEEL